jgi:hypothetical protein
MVTNTYVKAALVWTMYNTSKAPTDSTFDSINMQGQHTVNLTYLFHKNPPRWKLVSTVI